MPEVCEVRLTALYLNSKLKTRYLTNIEIVNGRYINKPLPGYEEFMKNRKYKFKSVNSKGKFIWFELEEPKSKETWWLMNGLGLEGRWSFKKISSQRIKFTIEDDKRKYTLWFCDQRNFGNLRFTKDRSVLDKKLNNLGPDLLQESFSSKDMYDRIKKFVGKSTARKNMKLVKVMLNYQEKGIGSGIGNYLSAEILYRAKISPHCTMQSLIDNPKYVDNLTEAIKFIIKLCFLTVISKYTDHFEIWIKNNRDKYNYHKDVNIGKNTFSYKVYRKDKDEFGNIVTGEEIIKGRKTYWTPKIQMCV